MRLRTMIRRRIDDHKDQGSRIADQEETEKCSRREVTTCAAFINISITISTRTAITMVTIVILTHDIDCNVIAGLTCW